MPSTSSKTNEPERARHETLEIIRKLAEAGEIDAGNGGVPRARLVEELALTSSAIKKHLSELRDEGSIEKVHGWGPISVRPSYLPVETASDDDDGREIRADGGQSSSGTERWWSDKTPSLRGRIGALAKVFLSVRFEDELRSAVAARPRTRPMGEDNFVGIDLYKIWFVLHYDQHGDDRTTNLYMRKIGDTHAGIDRIHESSIQAGLLPLKNDEWQHLQPATDDNGGEDRC